jgi:ABC-2 type transport system permease protein
MIKTIIYHEFLNLYRERMALLLVLVASGLTLLGLFNGQERVNEQQRTINKIANEQQQAIEKARAELQQRGAHKTPRNWWDDVADVRGYAFYLMVDYAVKPPSLLAPLAIGQSDLYPYFFRMQVDTKQAVLQEKNTEHPLVRAVGQFDLCYFLVFILPLLLITINFNAVAQERERDQLKLLIVQGLSPTRLLLLQLATRTGLVLLPVLLITGLWLIGSPALLHKDVDIGFLLQVAGVLLIIGAYSLFWILLSAWCIAKGKSPAYNATILVACWLLLAVAIPMVSNTLVNFLAPLPSRITYINDLRTATDQVERNSEKTLAGFFQDHPELAQHQASSQDYALVKIAKIDAIEKSMRGLEQEFSTQLDAQYRIGNRLKWLSPASLFYQSLITVSGNGLAQQRDFLQRVEAHHRALRHYFQQKIIAANERGDFNVCATCQTPVTFADFDTQPRFALAEHKDAQSGVVNSGLFLLGVLFINVLMAALVLMAGFRLNNSIEVSRQ